MTKLQPSERPTDYVQLAISIAILMLGMSACGITIFGLTLATAIERPQSGYHNCITSSERLK